MRKYLLLIPIFLLTLVFHLPNANAEVKATTVVLLDTSGSMRGEKLESAKSLLINSIERDQHELVLYTFAEELNRIFTGAMENGAARTAITEITAGSRTSLYDSIRYLLGAVENSSSTIFVISDGGDSQSTSSLEELLRDVRGSGIRISFFKQFIAPRYRANVEEIVRTSGGALVDSLPKADLPQIHEKAEVIRKSSISTGAIGLSVGYSVLFILLALRIRSRHQERGKLSADRLLIERDRDESGPRFTLAQLLKNAGNWIRIQLNQGRRKHQFESELPAALKMLAGSLAAGLSFLQALHAYAEDGKGASAQEFRRALSEIQLGVPVERALESVADRMKSDDLKWAVSAFAIQREVGGSLASILKSTAETIESRFELRREIKTLSAEGRISTYVLMALPGLIFLFLALLRPSYISFYVTQPLGNLILLLVSISLGASWIWMRSLVRIDI
jgi:hypothetical protein